MAFIDSAGERGRPKLKTSFPVVGKSIKIRILDADYFELVVPEMHRRRPSVLPLSVKITKENARKLAYWLLDNIKE